MNRKDLESITHEKTRRKTSLKQKKEKKKIRGTSRARLKSTKKTSNEIKFFFLLLFNETTQKNVFDLV